MYVGFIWLMKETSVGRLCMCGNVWNFLAISGIIKSARVILAHELVTYIK
jgi:hypothetical protein